MSETTTKNQEIEDKIIQLGVNTIIQFVRNPIITKSERETEGHARMFQWMVIFPGGITVDYYTGRAHVEVIKGALYRPSSKSDYHRLTHGNLTAEGMRQLLQYVKPKKPKLKDILYSLTMDAEATQMNFKEWSENFGYSDDSIEALNTYKACIESGEKLSKLGFRLNDMREFYQEY